MRLGCLPVDGDDAVHRVHQRLLVGCRRRLRGIGKAVDRVIGPGRGDGLVLAAQISRHGRHSSVPASSYTGASANGLKDNMPSKSAKARRPELRRKVAGEADRHAWPFPA